MSTTCLPWIFVGTFCNNRGSIPASLQHPSRLRIQTTSAGARGRNQSATHTETGQKLLPPLLSIALLTPPWEPRTHRCPPPHWKLSSGPSRGCTADEDYQICGNFTQEPGKALPDHATRAPECLEREGKRRGIALEIWRGGESCFQEIRRN